MANDERALVCRVLTRFCALPLEHVLETMRPLPVNPVAGVPRFVGGVAIIRGAPVPVVDLAWLLAGDTGTPKRFVTVTAGDRHVALAVEAVIGVRNLPTGSLTDLPPLLRNVKADTVTAVGTLDDELLVVLQSARLVPESVWDLIERETS